MFVNCPGLSYQAKVNNCSVCDKAIWGMHKGGGVVFQAHIHMKPFIPHDGV